MPVLPLTAAAKMPERLSPFATLRNQPPIAKPVQRAGASLVTIESPIGDRQSSPADCNTYTIVNVQNGICSRASSRCANANISSKKAEALAIMPSPNLNGIDGLRPDLPSHTHSAAMGGASATTARELTDWNHAT